MGGGVWDGEGGAGGCWRGGGWAVSRRKRVWGGALAEGMGVSRREKLMALWFSGERSGRGGVDEWMSKP